MGTLFGGAFLIVIVILAISIFSALCAAWAVGIRDLGKRFRSVLSH